MIKRYSNVQLRSRNSFHIEAIADQLIEYQSADELREIFECDLLGGKAWRVLGGGNNILFTGDYHGTLLHPVDTGIAITAQDDQQAHVHIEGGREWDDAVEWCVERGLWGIENLSMIPGYAGTAPVQNIGAYGCEIKDVIESVEVYFTDTMTTGLLPASQCGFGYRDSIFKRELAGKAIVTAVNLRLEREGRPNLGYGHLEAKVREMGDPTLENIRRAVIEIRSSKLPDPAEIGNAGSFFKNPIVPRSAADKLSATFPAMPTYPAPQDGFVKLAAGWLIEQAGWRGGNAGRAGVHPAQALVLVNLGGASGNEILTLARQIQHDVLEKFGVEIEPEVNIV